MSELSPEALNKARAGIALLDAIADIVRRGVAHFQVIVPFIDVTVTLNVTVARVENNEPAAPAEEIRH